MIWYDHLLRHLKIGFTFLLQHTHTHPFNGSLSRTTRVSRYQKGKTNLDFTEASVAVASAGPYASLHLALQITMPAPHHSVFTAPHHSVFTAPHHSVFTALPAAETTVSKH